MNTKIAILWGATVLAIALLNILEVLPDWTTLTAMLTLPFVSSASARSCRFTARQ